MNFARLTWELHKEVKLFCCMMLSCSFSFLHYFAVHLFLFCWFMTHFLTVENFSENFEIKSRLIVMQARHILSAHYLRLVCAVWLYIFCVFFQKIITSSIFMFKKQKCFDEIYVISMTVQYVVYVVAPLFSLLWRLLFCPNCMHTLRCQLNE